MTRAIDSSERPVNALRSFLAILARKHFTSSGMSSLRSSKGE